MSNSIAQKENCTAADKFNLIVQYRYLVSGQTLIRLSQLFTKKKDSTIHVTSLICNDANLVVCLFIYLA